MDTITTLATDDRRARMVLACLTEPVDAVTGRLVRQLGAVETVELVGFQGTVAGMSRVEAGLWRTRLGERADASLIRSTVQATETRGLNVLVPHDEAWPGGLAALGDRAPLALWMRGDVGLLTTSLPGLVTVTGARAATAYGEHVASTLAGDLAGQGRIVVSGAAYGIDAAAHRAALASGRPSIAVMASGVDRPYPAGHRELVDGIADNGVLVSEMPPGTAPSRERLIQRGRLLAAVSGVTVIVEAGFRSGSLNMARVAAGLGRPVGVVPGPVTSATSAGTHRLLREGTATLVTDASDVTALLQPQRSRGGPTPTMTYDPRNADRERPASDREPPPRGL